MSYADTATSLDPKSLTKNETLSLLCLHLSERLVPRLRRSTETRDGVHPQLDYGALAIQAAFLATVLSSTSKIYCFEKVFDLPH